MANNIALAEKFVPLLDEVYKAASKSSILDTPAEQLQFINANTVNRFKIAMTGLGDYDRNGGFVQGSVTGSWEAMTLSQDRGTSFNVDAMDNEETLGMAFGKLSGEFIRTQVAPEIDAYTFANIAGTSGISTGTAADIVVGTTDVAALLNAAQLTLNENEVPREGRILFISETAYGALKSNLNRAILNGENGINDEITMYNGMRVVTVPQSRFYSGITLYDGSSQGETDGGYVGTSGAHNINFLIVHPSAIVKVAKHVKPRIFAPDVNQGADAWKFDYRIYHDSFVEENKVDGVYAHLGATALV